MFKPEKIMPWYSSLTHWFFIAFISLANILKGPNQLRMIGFAWIITLAVAYFQSFSSRVSVFRNAPKELWSYTLWGLWAIFSGIFVFADAEVFSYHALKFIQIAITMWAVFLMIRLKKSIDVIYLAVVFAAAFQISAILMGYNYNLQQEMVVQDVGLEDNVRVTGLTSNPNVLAGLIVLSISCASQFWHFSKKPIQTVVLRCLIVGFAIVASYVVLQSGSRKAAIYLMIFLCGWLIWLCPIGRGGSGILMRLFFVILLISVAGVAISFVMEDTTVGARFRELLNKGQGSYVAGAEENIRTDMYREGIKIFLTHPIAGVGIGQFGRYFYTGQYSHSDYIEPLACTGLVGFLLYHSFYWILMVRLFRLRRQIRDSEVRYTLGVMILTLICILIWGIGSPQWSDVVIFMLLTSYAIYAWTLDRKMRGLESMSADERKHLVKVFVR